MGPAFQQQKLVMVLLDGSLKGIGKRKSVLDVRTKIFYYITTLPRVDFND
jgi:hypothetical protein